MVLKASTSVTDKARAAADRWLRKFSPQTRLRGEDLRANGAVSKLKIAHAGTTIQALVQGTYLYSVSLRHHEKNGWSGACACPMAVDCKHCYATMLAAQDAWSDEDDDGPHEPGERPSAKRAKPRTFAEILFEKLGRKLSAPETALAKEVDLLDAQFRQSGFVARGSLNRILGSGDRWDSENIEIWPEPPADLWQTWLYLAAHFRRMKVPLPATLAPIVDWAEVDVLVSDWERKCAAEFWRNWLETAARSTSVPAPARHQLRVRLGDEEATLEWRKNGVGEFRPMPHNGFSQLQSEAVSGQLPDEEASLRIWRAFNTGYGASPSVIYTSPDAGRILNLVLRDELLNDRIVGSKGEPLPRIPDPLRWQVEIADGSRTDYRLRLVCADGATPPPVLVEVDGTPALYASDQGIFTAPPLAGLVPGNTAISIPAEAIENSAGVSLFERMGAEPPPRLAARVRTVRFRLVFRCRLEINKLDDNERLVIEALAESEPGVAAEAYHKDGWQPCEDVPTPPEGQILRVDRSALAPTADLIAALKPAWWPYDREWHKQVGKRFADQFADWMSAMPAEVTLILDPVLASFRDAPVRASVKLEVEESGIDWFDLRIALDVADTTLTKAEIKALLDARGGFVRLGAKGWRRLRFDLSAEDEAQLAELGLSAQDLNGSQQRLHALQLAGKTATKRLLAEEHTRAIERRAEEIRTRVSPPVPEILQAELRPYQLEGFHFLAYLSTNRFGGILADDMGLGKTLQTLAWLLWLRVAEGVTDPAHQKYPILVVCPKSVVDNWRTESARFAPTLRVVVVPRGADQEDLKIARKEADIVVMNYAQLRILEGPAISESWLAVVLDEAQAIKNPESATARAAWSLKCAHRLALSGTPIENRLLDLWSIMQFAMPGVLGNRSSFGKTFDQRSDPFARRRLAARVRPFVIRRTKGEVAKDLPERVEEDILCELEGSQGTLYRAELKRARAALLKIETKAELDKARFNILTSLMRLRQICCHPVLIGAKAKKKVDEEQPESAKLAALLELVEPLIEEGHKVLVFSQFVEMLNLIRAEFVARDWKHFMLTGETEDRGTLVSNFQNCEGSAVFLISLRAGGFGLNLTAASYVVLFDPWWNPAVENQAIDRTHRIGQRNTVIAYRLIMKQTIEEKIRSLQKQKSALATDVLGEEAFARTLSIDDFRFLFGE